MKYTHYLLGVGMTLVAGLLFVTPVVADNAPSCSVLPQAICASETQNNANDVTKSSVFQIIIWVLRILTGGVGIAAIGAFVYAGIMYSSSNGDSTQVGKAKTLMMGTVIGLIAYGLMFIVLNWLIPGGIFG